jgi:hypothetical protein
MDLQIETRRSSAGDTANPKVLAKDLSSIDEVRYG